MVVWSKRSAGRDEVVSAMVTDGGFTQSVVVMSFLDGNAGQFLSDLIWRTSKNIYMDVRDAFRGGQVIKMRTHRRITMGGCHHVHNQLLVGNRLGTRTRDYYRIILILVVLGIAV